MISLLIDGMVRLDGNIKAHVMKALFKKTKQHSKKVCILSKQRQKWVFLNQKIEFGYICANKCFLGIRNQN